MKKAGAEHARLLKMYSQTGRELGLTQASRHAAVDEDRHAYAYAVGADKAVPGTKHTDAADKRLAQIKRKHEALELAITAAHAEAAVDNRDDLVEVSTLAAGAAFKAYREAIDTLGTAQTRLSTAMGTRYWLLRLTERSSIASALTLVRDLRAPTATPTTPRPSSPPCATWATFPSPSSTRTARSRAVCTSPNADPRPG